MRSPRLLARLGPQTRLAFGISPHDDAAVVRGKVAAVVTTLLGKRSDDLRTAALAALALTPEADQRLLGDRQEWLAGQLFCDGRTARRRIDDAFIELVDAIVEEDARRSRAVTPDDGWMVRRLRATVRLDRPGPELYEQRTVQVTADVRSSLVGKLSLPHFAAGGGAPRVSVRSVYGGQVVSATRVAPEHFQFTVALPRPLKRGETHDYGVLIALPPGHPLRPHFVYQPLLPCDEFELVVHFDPAAPPLDVWCLTGVPLRVVDTGTPGPDRLTPDRHGVVRASFERLRQGLSYGIKWIPA